MKPLILLPKWYQPIGWVLIVTAINFRVFGWHKADWLGVLADGDIFYLLLGAGFFCVSTARESVEDERVAYLRARAWQWAAFVFGLGFVLTYAFFTTDLILWVNEILFGRKPDQDIALNTEHGKLNLTLTNGIDVLDWAVELLNAQAAIFLGLFVLRFRLYLFIVFSFGLKIGIETSPDPLRRTGHPQVSAVRILFGVFVIVSPYFPLLLSLLVSGIE